MSDLNTHAWSWDLEAGLPTSEVVCPDGVLAAAISGRGHRVVAGGGQPNAGRKDWKVRLLGLSERGSTPMRPL